MRCIITIISYVYINSYDVCNILTWIYNCTIWAPSVSRYAWWGKSDTPLSLLLWSLTKQQLIAKCWTVFLSIVNLNLYQQQTQPILVNVEFNSTPINVDRIFCRSTSDFRRWTLSPSMDRCGVISIVLSSLTLPYYIT